MTLSRRAALRAAALSTVPLAAGCSDGWGRPAESANGRDRPGSTTVGRADGDGTTDRPTGTRSEASRTTPTPTSTPAATRTPTTTATTTPPVRADPDHDLLVLNRSDAAVSVAVEVRDLNAGTTLLAESYDIEPWEEAGVYDLVTKPGDYRFVATLSDGPRVEAMWAPVDGREALMEGVYFSVPERGELRVSAPEAE